MPKRRPPITPMGTPRRRLCPPRRKHSLVEMDTATSLIALGEMHPELEWREIAAATVAVLEDRGLESPFAVELDVVDVPGFGSDSLALLIDRSGISADRVDR